MTGQTDDAGSVPARNGGGPRAGRGKKVSPLMKTVIIAVIVVILVAVPIGYLALTSGDEADDVDLAVIVVGETSEVTVDYSDLEDMDFVEAVSSYQNRFGNWRALGTYGGVELRDLADLVGGMGPGDMMSVVAADGYRVNLTYEQVYADEEYLSIQGRIILAYMFNGTLMDEADRPMLAVLAPDGGFSNDDFNATRSTDPEFAYLTSAGSLWVKTVARIEISGLDRTETATTAVDNTIVQLASPRPGVPGP